MGISDPRRQSCARCLSKPCVCDPSKLPRPSVNDHQIGGDHYKSEYQHWDFVIATGQNYLQGCATKYISRWRRKDGLIALEKALHYVDKNEAAKLQKIPFNVAEVFRFVHANDLNAAEAAAIWSILAHEWEQARVWINQIISDVRAADAGRLQPI